MYAHVHAMYTRPPFLLPCGLESRLHHSVNVCTHFTRQYTTCTLCTVTDSYSTVRGTINSHPEEYLSVKARQALPLNNYYRGPTHINFGPTLTPLTYIHVCAPSHTHTTTTTPTHTHTLHTHSEHWPAVSTSPWTRTSSTRWVWLPPASRPMIPE